jgi:riboflavin synthase
MFSGLIKKIGTVIQNKPPLLIINVNGLNPVHGDSISINGTCLTLVKKKKLKKNLSLYFELSNETYAKTTLKNLRPGSFVNIEPALGLSDALGGHIVQGHVDNVGHVDNIIVQKDMKTIWFRAPKSLMDFIVSKGSITVDGVSLTVVDIKKNKFSVALIPYTLQHTTLKSLKVGDGVNLETDVLAKYISNYLKNK